MYLVATPPNMKIGSRVEWMNTKTNQSGSTKITDEYLLWHFSHDKAVSKEIKEKNGEYYVNK